MQISSNYNVSFGHIYSNAVDSVLRNHEGLTKKQEAQLDKTVERASALNKSVITSSTQKGLVLLFSENGQRALYKTYPLGSDIKTKLEQLEDVVKDAEHLEKSELQDIDPLMGTKAGKSTKGFCESIKNYPYQHVYDKTYNGYAAKF